MIAATSSLSVLNKGGREGEGELTLVRDFCVCTQLISFGDIENRRISQVLESIS